MAVIGRRIFTILLYRCLEWIDFYTFLVNFKKQNGSLNQMTIDLCLSDRRLTMMWSVLVGIEVSRVRLARVWFRF